MGKGQIWLIGDTHGSGELFANKGFPEGKDLTEDDVVIQLGDWGLVYDNPQSKEEKYWLNFVAEKPWTQLVLLGNHDYHQMVWDLPQEQKFNGTVYVDHRFGGSIWYLKTGEVYTIQDKTFLAVHGGLSIDRHLRTEGFGWWPTEMLSKDQEEDVLNSLDDVNWKVDYVLTHTCPDSVVYAFLDNPNSEKFRDPVSRFLEFIANKLEFKEWHFGHFHNSRAFEDAASDYYECHIGSPKELTWE
jgi:predicted phosphodiesterase